MINVAASDLFIRGLGANIYNYIVTSCMLKEQMTAVMSLDVMKWQKYLCDDVMSGTNV